MRIRFRNGEELFCRDCGDRVKISGGAVPYMEGTIKVAP
jgi:hypothetical protein